MLSDPLQYLARAIGRTIVDGNDFKMGIPLSEQRSDAAFDLPLLVACRNND